MKIKIINPNTSRSMTEKIGEAAKAVASAGVQIVATSPSMGPESIESHYDEAFATVGVLDEIRSGELDGFDGYVIACFGDPALFAAREIANGPVVGIAEAAMRTATLIGRGFSIISTLERSRPTLEDMVRRYGMEKYCRSIRSTDLAVLKLEEEGSNAHQTVVNEARRALVEDGSDCVILGCGGMSNLFTRVSSEINAPAIDGVSAAVKLVEGLISLGLRTSKVQSFGFPPRKSFNGMFKPFELPNS